MEGGVPIELWRHRSPFRGNRWVSLVIENELCRHDIYMKDASYKQLKGHFHYCWKEGTFREADN